MALFATSVSANETLQGAHAGNVSQRAGRATEPGPAPRAARRKTELGECFLSHVLHSRIKVSCDQDLFFAPLHRSFYAYLYPRLVKSG